MRRLLSVMLALLMVVAVIAAAIPVSAAKVEFSDVTESMWSFGSIEYAVRAGYMKGVGGGRFDPEGALTRGMVVTVLWRREGSPAPEAASGFSDVPSGEWYADAVAWAKNAGVVMGLSEVAGRPGMVIVGISSLSFFFFLGSSRLSHHQAYHPRTVWEHLRHR